MRPSFLWTSFRAATASLSLLQAAALALMVASTPQAAAAADGTWTATTSGSWTTTSSWSGGIVGTGTGFTAWFAPDITSDVTVTNNQQRAIGTSSTAPPARQRERATGSSPARTWCSPTEASPALQTTVGGLDPNAGGLVDVRNGSMTVAAGLSEANMLTALLAGRGDGSWSGSTGITSSQAQADIATSSPRTVGWLNNGDGSMTFAFAAPGDTNLDWNVDILDAADFLSTGLFDAGAYHP